MNLILLLIKSSLRGTQIYEVIKHFTFGISDSLLSSLNFHIFSLLQREHSNMGAHI
jgi:hypothetical protein